MLNFLDAALQAFRTLIALLTFGIREAFEFISVISESLILIFQCIDVLPVELSVFAIAGIGVTVILTIFRY